VRAVLARLGLKKTVTSCRVGIGILFFLFLVFLTGCSDFVDSDQPVVAPEVEILLEPGHSVGQTFVARHGGLNGVAFWLEPAPNSAGSLILHVRSDSQSPTDLFTDVLSLESVTTAGFYRFSFGPDYNSHGVYRYVFLEMDGVGAVRIGAAPGATYIDGAAYRNHEPLDAQIAFQLSYNVWGIVLELGHAVLTGTGLLIAAAVVYLIPGYALLAFYPSSFFQSPFATPTTGSGKDATHGGEVPWPARMGLAAGISLALYPLLILWTDLMGLHLGLLYVWLPVTGGLAVLVWRYRHWRPRQGWAAIHCWVRSPTFYPDLAFVFLMMLVFGVRLLVVRTLDAPMWGDSYHHTMIAQLLADNGGLFDSWAPYAELQTFTYHFGFHSAVAVFHWFTGIAMHKATLWVGQILNGLAVLVLYPLIIWLGGNRWSGVIAILAVGLLLPMPMYYVNWGRYTQLAGQVILPATIVLSGACFESPRWKWSLVGLVWVVIGGLALTHYRVLIFYVIFVTAFLILRVRKNSWRRVMFRVCGAGTGAVVLFLPWFLETLAGRITSTFFQQLTTAPEQVSPFIRQYNAIGDLTLYMPPVLWLIFMIAIGLALWRRRHGFLLVLLWWFLILLATNPEWLSLPGTGSISNFALLICIYIPAGLLIGDMLGEWITQRSEKLRWMIPLTAATVCALGVAGFPVRMKDLDVARHALVTRPDLRAMVWIRENTPENAHFLVNSFFAYGGSLIVGSDGGWWLPLLANRANTAPPILYVAEQGSRTDYVQWINDLSHYVINKGINSPETLTMLRERNIRYVYIGKRQGRVNYDELNVLSPETLLNSPHYRLVYNRDRVLIFEMVQ
jgi:hypothetical protein